MAVQRVVLWGFMASGKTVVGAALADRLGWEHVDLDAEIVRRAGRSIADIFRGEGEPAFRRMEAEVTRALLPRRGVVFSPGGGWVANPGMLAAIPDHSLTVWLRASPEAILERLRADDSGIERPLLRTPDPAATVRRLLSEREALYRQADRVVRTDGRAVESLVDEIEAAVRAARAGLESSHHTQDA